MPAIRLECRGPSGDHFDLVALRGHIVAPEAMRHQPGLWWLESEEHPRLGMEAAEVLEEATGSRRLGCWPYCVPEERWNDAAAHNRWLPRSSACDSLLGAGLPVITDRRIEALRLPSRPPDFHWLDSDPTPIRSVRERLNDGWAAVGHLFEQVRRVPRIVLSTASLTACACYLAAVASWLWGLHGGLSRSAVEDGIVLLLAALLASWITSLFEVRVRSDAGARLRLPRTEGRDRQPLLHLALDAYRAGVVLQLLAFAGFVLM